MKVVIAGSRHNSYTVDQIQEAVDASGFTVTTLISGAATGVDSSAEKWASEKGIPIIQFPADWDRYGGRAGPLRNSKMAVVGQALIAFPGGPGTASMVGKMQALEKPIFVWNKHEES